MNRIFFGISLGEQIETTLKEHQQVYKQVKGIKIERDLHCTIKFIGEVSDEKLEKIMEHIKEFKFWKFLINVTKTETFPSIIKPRCIIAEIEHAEHLENLKKVLEEYLFKFVEKDERQFRPHVTLVRNKVLSSYEFVNLQKKHETTFNLKTEITGLTLFKTIQTQKGVMHEELMQIKFN